MSSPRILLADDDPNLRWVLQTQLEELGFSVQSASDASEAIRMIESEVPSLLLTDLKMPRHVGHGTTSKGPQFES